MKVYFYLSLFLICGSLCAADETMRATQEALKTDGFYFGEVDGAGGAETDAAIRRYQIRNGLSVTGKLNEETLKSLGIGAAIAKPADQDVVPAPPATSAPMPSEIRIAPIVPQPPVARPPQPTIPSFSLRGYFARTPYETAPPGMQQEIVRRAQFILHQAGYYEGGLDGAPGPSTVRAMERFQRDRRMVTSGRLDMPTLDRMRLMPIPVPGPGYYGNPWAN